MSHRRSHPPRPASAPSTPPRRGWARSVYVVLVMVVGVAAGALALRPLLGRERASGNVITVRADMGGFTPSVIRARTGQPIRIRLRSLDTQFHMDGGGRHQLAIDALGINLIALPLGSADTMFVVPRPGVYEFYCSLCCGGKANPAMWGRLIVT